MYPTERYLSIDSKMKGSPLSLEEVMRTKCCYIGLVAPGNYKSLILLFSSYFFFLRFLDDFDDNLLLKLLL